MEKYNAILVTTKEWLDKAVEKDLKVFHFPPERGNDILLKKLSKDSICILYVTDTCEFVGEFTVMEIKKVDWIEFEKYKPLAYKIAKVPFPRYGQSAWIIIFDKIKLYKNPVKKSECADIRGYTWRTTLKDIILQGTLLIRPIDFENVIVKIRQKGIMTKTAPECVEKKRPKVSRSKIPSLSLNMIKNILKKYPHLNEYQTIHFIILPLLEQLGWNIKDPDEVVLQYMLPTRDIVDIVLRINKKPVVVVEVKAISENLNYKAVKQVLNYANLINVDWAILTNGKELRVYNNSWRFGDIDKRLFFKIKLENLEKDLDLLSLISKESFEMHRIDEIANKKLAEIALKHWIYNHYGEIINDILQKHPKLNKRILENLIQNLLLNYKND